MEDRTKNFIEKFKSANKYLGGDSIHNIISLKYRDFGSRSNYHGFIADFLETKGSVNAQPVHGDFQGNALLIEDHHHNTVILVEHETGLEILFIASAIASLISLIPMIGSGWKYFRYGRQRPHFDEDENSRVEIRKINSKNQLEEEFVFRAEDYILAESLKEIVVLQEKVMRLEKELAKIKGAKSARVAKSKKPAKKNTVRALRTK